MLASLRVFLDYMRRNYKQTLARISSLVSHGEITFDLLYAILVPGTIIIKRDTVTRETRAVRLLNASKQVTSCGQFYRLSCECLEEIATENEDDNKTIGWSDADETQKVRRFGWVGHGVSIADFNGVEKISALSAFPIQYHPDTASIRAMLVARGRKWASLTGMHHVQYRGGAGRWEWVGNNQKLTKYTVGQLLCRASDRFTNLHFRSSRTS